jgi:hypothetical protein
LFFVALPAPPQREMQERALTIGPDASLRELLDRRPLAFKDI